MCLVFRVWYLVKPSARHIKMFTTKHQILNTLVNKSFFDFLRDCQLYNGPIF